MFLPVVRVLLVEDVDDLRATLKQALRLHGGFEVVADAADGAAAIAAAGSTRPDVVVLDLGLPDLAGAELVTRIRAAAPDARIVVYTGAVNHDRSALDVDAFVSKDQGVRYLVSMLADVSRAASPSAQIMLGPGVEDVLEARRFLEERCREWDCGDLIPGAQLVVSELVTNALLHGGGTCQLRVRCVDGGLRIEVHDSGAGTPDLLVADTESESGRGLLIVSSVAEAWGVDTVTEGKVVWAELVNA